MTEDVAAIAKGLTKAQREALTYAPDDCIWMGSGNLGKYKPSFAAMDRADLGKPALTECRFSLGRLFDARLTPLGLAVRQHLLAHPGVPA